MPRLLPTAGLLLLIACTFGCFHIAALSMEVENNNPLNYRTLHVTVIDADGGTPVEGVQIWTTYAEYGVKTDWAVTGADGKAKIRVWKWHPQLAVRASGYARDAVSRSDRRSGSRTEVVLVIARPQLVGVELVLPHDWRGPINVLEYVGSPEQDWWSGEPQPDPQLQFSATRITVMAFSRLPETGRPSGFGAYLRQALRDRPQPPEAYRVISARTDSGVPVPIYRDAPPADGGFGLYHIGYFSFDEYGYGAGIFVLGTLTGAQGLAREKYADFQWWPNVGILGTELGTKSPRMPGR